MNRTLLSMIVFLVVGVVTVVQAGEPQPSDTCGSCHRDIYRMWRSSAHAEATEDPFFFQAYLDVVNSGQKAKAKICLDCHAPLVNVNQDHDLKLGLTREGVNCDFCHSLADVRVTDRGPQHQLEVGNVKRGTIAKAESPAHGVAYSDLHASSLVCAPCHEYVSTDGVAILTTFSEWESSTAAERGETCQACHMAITEGQVVDPKLGRESSAKVNLHEMPGGHSIQQLLQALDVKVRPSRNSDAIVVDVTVTNEGAGHAVPTGMPGRRIILEVGIDAGKGETYQERRFYVKRFKGASGKPLEHVADYFGPGVELEADTRILPDESRIESFEFPVSSSSSAYLTVKLHYEYAPQGDQAEMDRVTFYTDRKLLRRASEG